MEHLPPAGWADVATKRDLDHLAAITKSDLDALRVELRSEIGELSGTFDRLSGELHRSMASQTRAVIIATFGMMATSIGGVVSVAALTH